MEQLMTDNTNYPKRLIEVDLPIKRISAHARREKSIPPSGHISTMHIWWARRPLASCRAVICAALWLDPADPMCPTSFQEGARSIMKKWASESLSLLKDDVESFNSFSQYQKDPNKLNDNKELRQALLDFISSFAIWDNGLKPEFLKVSRDLTQLAHQSLVADDNTKLLVADPFSGGGAIPLEALRIGADTVASDLNPLPILLNKVIQEYVPQLGSRLVEQVKQSSERIRKKLKDKLDHFYVDKNQNEIPQVFFWARTVICEGPGCGYKFPLLKSLWLRNKEKNKIALSLVSNPSNRAIEVKLIFDAIPKEVKPGTSKQGAATCPVCGYTTPVERVRDQLSKRKGGAVDSQLFAISTTKSGSNAKQYRSPSEEDLKLFSEAKEQYLVLQSREEDGVSVLPNEKLNHLRGFFNVVLYGMDRWGDLFNPRQALLMITLTKLIKEEYQELIRSQANIAEATVTCLALITGRMAQYNSSCCRWNSVGETVVDMFGRQAIPMVWDFVENYPFRESTGDMSQYTSTFCNVLRTLNKALDQPGMVLQASATSHPFPDDSIDAFITDPPYYDAIPYADLSDYFYVWFRRILKPINESLFRDALSPKDEECVTLSHRAAMYRHKDRNFFEKMMGLAAAEGCRITKATGIGVVVFANKSTAGWEAIIQALIDGGWVATASWPIDTERPARLRALDSAALASSIHIVCRPRKSSTLEIGDWRDILQELPKRINEWMPRLAAEGVVGADAIFACLGPALEIFSRYSRVEKASGEQVKLKDYLEHVWAAVAKEALNMIFTGADATGFEEDARLTAMWLWTLTARNNSTEENSDEVEDEDDEDSDNKPAKTLGFMLEFDAARKIAQGLGAHLENLVSLVEVKKDKARLLPVSERGRYLFGKQEEKTTEKGKKKAKKEEQLAFSFLGNEDLGSTTQDDKFQAKPGSTVLDRIHQSMLLFSAGRSEALKRFLVEDGVGQDQRFWRLAQALSALYPTGTNEKRWVDGVLARKKGLGF